MTIHNCNVNHMKEQGFPPVSTLLQHIVFCQSLIRSVNTIHKFVIPFDCRWLLHILICLPLAILVFVLPGDSYCIICMVYGGQQCYYSIVLSLQRQTLDIRKGIGLARLFNTIHDLRFSYFE